MPRPITRRLKSAPRTQGLMLAALLWLAAAGLAHAQYIWIDDKGVRHYSDRPPEGNVPSSRILKTPAAADGKPAADPTATPDGNAAATAETTPAAGTAQKNADFKKRRSEQQDKEKKAAEEAQRKSANSATCERLAQYQKALAGGERIALPGQNGQRRFLTEEQRTAEMKENSAHLNDCKAAQ